MGIAQALRKFFIGEKKQWEWIGSNRNSKGIPRWVKDAFWKMPGSHGTQLIQYPEPGMSVYLKGKTFRYRIDMGSQEWQVYRRLRWRVVRLLRNAVGGQA